MKLMNLFCLKCGDFPLCVIGFAANERLECILIEWRLLPWRPFVDETDLAPRAPH